MKTNAVKFLIILIMSGCLLVFTYLFLASPHRVSGSPISPFKRGQFILSEKMTYLFFPPEVGDRVIFQPVEKQVDSVGAGDFVGIIMKKDSDLHYTIQSREGSPWIVSRKEIKERIYYPF
ncbi:hypothetical protein HYW41_00465 [Candidatus Daviesbacteria bacterium]|nr:hypothetical protein [Candidatus Daviesbacteria bacterium]